MIPLKNTNPFVEMFNELVDREVTEFERARIRKELNAFAKSGSYDQTQEFEGMYAALINDIPSIYKHFNASLKYSGGDSNTKFNYAVSLSNVFELIESINIVDELINIYADDINVLKTLLDICEGAFDWEKGGVILDKLVKLGYDDKEYLDESRHTLSLKRQISLENDVTWQEIATEIASIGRLIVSQNYKVRYIAENIRPELSNIFIEFALNTDQDELIRIDNLIVENISSKPYSKLDSILTFSCKSFEQ